MRRLSVISAVLALILLGAGACASRVLAFTPPPTDDPTFWAMQGRLDELAGRVVKLGAGFPDSYAGVALETEHGRLAVYRVPSPAFDAALHRELPDAPLRIVDGTHSANQLGTLRDRIAADFGYWRGQGVEVNTVSAAYDGSCVEVGTRDVDRVRRLFQQRYGADEPIRVVHADVVVAKPLIAVSKSP